MTLFVGLVKGASFSILNNGDWDVWSQLAAPGYLPIAFAFFFCTSATVSLALNSYLAFEPTVRALGTFGTVSFLSYSSTVRAIASL
jgi:hypothetical protein